MLNLIRFCWHVCWCYDLLVWSAVSSMVPTSTSSSASPACILLVKIIIWISIIFFKLLKKRLSFMFHEHFNDARSNICNVNYVIMLIPGDIILYFSLFQQSNQGKPDCDFLNQKVWICIWEILNLLGLLALIVALGE